MAGTPKAVADTPKAALVGTVQSLVRSPTQRVGFAIVGLGRAGHFHLSSMKAVVDIAALRWVIDTDEALARKVAEREGCDASTRIEDAINDPLVDAVIIASVTHTHPGFCRAALHAGKAVFTEKPVSHDPHELAEIIELARRCGRPFIVGYQRRVDPNFRELRRQVRERKSIGDIRLIKCCSRDNPLPPLEYLRVSGGIFYDMLCHDFDLVHFLTGQTPVEAYSAAHCYNADIAAMGDVDTVVVTLKYASGLLALIDCSRTAAYGYDQRVEVFGEQGMATAHNQLESTVVVADAAGHLHPPSQWSFPQRYKHTYTTELAEFVALVKLGSCEPDALVSRHIELDRVAAAAELSWRLGRAVRLEEVSSLRHVLQAAHATPQATAPANGAAAASKL